MIPTDIGFGFLAGLLSLLTPETLFLLPLLPGAAGASSRAGVAACLVGAGAALVLSGLAAGWLGTTFGLDALWLRRGAGALLLVLGLLLLSGTLTRRFPFLTGGSGGPGERAARAWFGGMVRQFLLALLVGVVWLPRLTPLLGKATLTAAAETLNYALALEILFAFGIGAVLPWVLLGRIARLILGSLSDAAPAGMAGKRLLGLALVAVAGVSLSGADVAVIQALDALLPNWVGRLAMTY